MEQSMVQRRHLVVRSLLTIIQQTIAALKMSVLDILGNFCELITHKIAKVLHFVLFADGPNIFCPGNNFKNDRRTSL